MPASTAPEKPDHPDIIGKLAMQILSPPGSPAQAAEHLDAFIALLRSVKGLAEDLGFVAALAQDIVAGGIPGALDADRASDIAVRLYQLAAEVQS